MTRKLKHGLVVEIDCLDAQGQCQAQDRLVRWLEHYGYTASGHGFEFISVGAVPRINKEKTKQCANANPN